MMQREILQPCREWINGVAYTVHTSRDGRIRVNTGPDDQRPEHDGKQFFCPLVVAQYMANSDSLYSYVDYCGNCRKRMRRYLHDKFCSRCGAGIAHYVFAMGKIEWRPTDWHAELPDHLPIFIENETLLNGGTLRLPA